MIKNDRVVGGELSSDVDGIDIWVGDGFGIGYGEEVELEVGDKVGSEYDNSVNRGVKYGYSVKTVGVIYLYVDISVGAEVRV